MKMIWGSGKAHFYPPTYQMGSLPPSWRLVKEMLGRKANRGRQWEQGPMGKFKFQARQVEIGGTPRDLHPGNFRTCTKARCMRCVSERLSIDSRKSRHYSNPQKRLGDCPAKPRRAAQRKS